MTCRAILYRDGQEHIPALLVRMGKLSARQCDHEYKGERGDCPACRAMLEATDFSDGSSFAAAMAGKDPVVQYRRASYGEGGTEPFRIPSFSHGPNYWAGVGMKSGDCSNPDRETHRLNLLALKTFYEQWHPGCKVVMESRLRAPGDPPRDYSPDLAVISTDGARLVAVEYQRSKESYEKFADRDELRLRERWASVDWWFDDTQNNPEKVVRTVYDRSEMHRTHLAVMERPIYRCWVDPVTFVMQYDYGCSGEMPPARRTRVERHIERADLQDCSIARAIKDLEGEPEESLIVDVKAPLRALPKAGAQGPGLAGVHPGLDLKYHLERERRVAEAAIARRARLDEQDRLHREFGHKCRLVQEIQEVAASTSILGGKGTTEATTRWTVEALERERDRLSGLMPEAVALAEERKREADRLEATRRRLDREREMEEEKAQLLAQLLEAGEHEEEQLLEASLWTLRRLHQEWRQRVEEALGKEAAHAKAEALRLQEAEAQAKAEAWREEQRRRHEQRERERQAAEEQARQLAEEQAQRLAAFRKKQEEEQAEQAKRAWAVRWGVPVGATGATVNWKRGLSFIGLITHWNKGRPVIEGYAGKKWQLQWASSPDDYTVVNGG